MRSFLKFSLRLVLVCVALVAVLFGLQVIASESGEVVVIRIPDASGEATSTRIWVVEDQGRLWVRGTERPGSWAERAAVAGRVELERGDEVLDMAVLRTVDPGVMRRINASFNQKYGWRDDLISAMIGDSERQDALILELLPASSSSVPAPTPPAIVEAEDAS